MRYLLELVGIKVEPLSLEDRAMIERVLARLQAGRAEEVHWPHPRPAIEGPRGLAYWLPRRG
jgi:hypothetical protein